MVLNNDTTMVSRRGFFIWFGGAVSGLLSSATGSYIQQYFPKIELKHKASKHKENLVKLLFKPHDLLRFHYGDSHYLRKGIHSDNRIVGKELIECVSSIIPVKPSDDSALFELNNYSDWVSIGAPSSNTIACEYFGLDINNIGMCIFIPNNLRYVYEYKEKMVDLIRTTASGEVQNIAKDACIRDLKNNNIYKPDEGGWIEEDYLLVTRIYDTSVKKFRLFIGGTHGIGTRGFSLFYEMDPFSKSQKYKIVNSPNGCYQILARVQTEIKDNTRSLSNIMIEGVHAW